MQFSNGNPIPPLFFFFFLAALGLCCGARASLVTEHRLFSTRAQQLWLRGLGVLWHVGSMFPNQGSNPCPLHWKVDS